MRKIKRRFYLLKIATRLEVALAIALFSLSLSGCSCEPTEPPPPGQEPLETELYKDVQSIAISPGSASLRIGDEVQFTATVINQEGEKLDSGHAN